MANLTLSVDDELLKKSRIFAIEHDTSVNALVRDYLRSLCADTAQRQELERRQAAAELENLIREVAAEARIPEGYRFKREDAYEDRDGRLTGQALAKPRQQ